MSSKVQILLFIVFAALLFLFIQVFSSNPKSKETEQNEAVVGQMILPTQPEAEETKKLFTNKGNNFSFEYPNDWVASPSAELLQEKFPGSLQEFITLMGPESLAGVQVQVNTNSTTLKKEDLFNCLISKKCETGTAGGKEYIKSVNEEGITSLGFTENNQIYVFKIKGPIDMIVLSLKFF